MEGGKEEKQISERKKDEENWAGLGGFLRIEYGTGTGVVGLRDQALRGLLPGRLSGNTRQVGINPSKMKAKQTFLCQGWVELVGECRHQLMWAFEALGVGMDLN